MSLENQFKTELFNEIPQGVGIMCDFFIERAKNAEIWTTKGKRYIDFTGGIGVLNTGHLHPKVFSAVTKQINLFSHSCYHIIPYELYTKVAVKINALAPIHGKKKTMFATTGAEAVENAIKIARAATHRRGIISFNGSFHGRTNLTLGLTGKISPYKANFGPFPNDIIHASYPKELYGTSVQDALTDLERIFQSHIAPSDVAAIIIEPIQGEGGFNITPFEYLKELRSICDQHGIILIFDEVQSGFARTGKFFATEHTKVEPDLITIAKSLAGGFPLSGVVGKADIMDAPQIGGLGGTYAGNPLALAAADAVIDIIQEERLCERAEKLGNKIKDQFEQLKGIIPQIKEIRGLGSMVAIEFMKPETNIPDPEFTKSVQKLALENGLIILTCGTHYNIIRFLFPLTIEDKTFQEALSILHNVLITAEKKRK